MNIITIDPSLSCTAVVVNGKRFAFVNRSLAFTKSGDYKKWFELSSSLVSYIFIDYLETDEYSANEIIKLDTYGRVTDGIMDIIMSNINPSMELQVFIEGYSFSSSSGPLIDLVTFSTLLRSKLYAQTELLTVMSPTTLKLEAAKLTYPAIPKGKKVIKYEYRNKEGMAGGSFKKHEMFKALVENESLTDDWTTFLRTHQEEILNYKSIPKPIEDVNDAMIMYFVASCAH